MIPRDLPNAEYHSGVLEWMNAALEEGLAAQRSQPGHSLIGATIDAIMGTDEPRILSPKLSHGRINKIQKIALEMRSMLTDIKPFWQYEANCKRYEKQAEIFGKLSKHWYLTRGIDQVFKDAIDYVLAAGSGYIHFFWNSEIPGMSGPDGNPTIGDIDCRAEDPRDVIPIRPSGDKRNLQSCRGVIVRRERPASVMKARYPAMADYLQADRQGYEKESPSARRMRDAQMDVMAGAGPFHAQLFGDLAGGAPHQKIDGPVPVTDEFTAYLHDFTLNRESKPRKMGSWIKVRGEDGRETLEPEFSWCYESLPGKPLYPFGRRIVFTRYGVIDDGPSHFHMNRFPLCKLTPDSWAWATMGSSSMQLLLPMQRMVDENVRVIQDHIARIGRPGLRYDKNSLPAALARKLDMRRDGVKIGHNPNAGRPVEAIFEPPLDPTVPNWLTFLLDTMDDLAGVTALKQLSSLNQIPSTETIDKMLEAMTPLVRARSQSLETFIREFAMMFASMVMQFYTLELRLRIGGAEMVTPEDWNYRPGDLVPDFIDDADYDERGNVSSEARERGPSPDYIRNREFIRFFSFIVAPGTLLDAATITKKLLYLQLARMGLVDHWTLLEILQVPNVGKPPDWATDITKRLQAERLMGLGIIASTVGRPPSGGAMPSLMPSGGISESG